MEDVIAKAAAAADRGKRRAANRILLLWMLMASGLFGSLVYVEMTAEQIEALLILFKVTTTFTGVAALGLYGLDATGVQIIPAIRGVVK